MKVSKGLFQNNRVTIIFLLFLILILSFFIIQHITYKSWDFVAYSLNAMHFSGDINYYEPYRPPIVPLFINIFYNIFGSIGIAEVCYIIAATIIAFVALKELASSLNLNYFILFISSFTPAFLFMGMAEGGELLAISFLYLAIAMIIKDKNSGFFLSLATLTRYNYLYFLPILLLHKKPKKILYNILLFLLPILPWLIFNYLKYGSPFASIIDAYHLNILNRLDMVQPPKVIHFIIILNIMVPFFLIGLIIETRRYFKKTKLNNFNKIINHIFENKMYYISLLAIVLTLYFYFTTPFKNIRYLYGLFIPSAYFSYHAIENLRKRSEIIFKTIYFIIIILIVISPLVFSMLYISNPSYMQPLFHKEAKNYVPTIQKFSGNCAIKTNSWVYLNYYGIPSEPFPYKHRVNYYIKEGYTIVLFKDIKEPEYTKETDFIQTLPVVFEDDKIIIIKEETNKCNELNHTILFYEYKKREFGK